MKTRRMYEVLQAIYALTAAFGLYVIIKFFSGLPDLHGS